MAEKIRVLIAEDSPTVRHYLVSLLSESPVLEVVGEAHNGEEAVQMVQQLKPDVVSMDIKMPLVDGLEATRRIMAQCPTPVVIVSGLLEGDVELSLQALEAGALAVVGKPPDRRSEEFPIKRQQLLTTLRAMAGVRVVARRDLLRDSPPEGDVKPAPSRRRVRPELIAIGASTGGPSALHRLLAALPLDLSVPVLIVQHMPTEFIPGLARWLGNSTALPVRLAEQGLRLRAGEVIIASGAAHMLVRRQDTGLILHLEAERGEHRYQPSIDALFESIARHCGSAAVGIVLTGMGDDGANGLLAMRQAGAYTYAQDEASSTVYGMPQAALVRGAVEKVESLSALPSEIVKVL